jgi:hypothetical protein
MKGNKEGRKVFITVLPLANFCEAKNLKLIAHQHNK